PVHRPVVGAAAPVPQAFARRAGARRAAGRLPASGRSRRSALTRPRVVFMGTPEFAVPSLHAVARATDVVLVVTPADRPSGRGLVARPAPVAVAAESLGLDVLK